MKKLPVLILVLLSCLYVRGQDSIRTGRDKFSNRKLVIGGLSTAGYAGSLIVLNEAWYKDYPKSKLHSFNDAKEWLQVDKVGHGWTAYNTSRATTAMWQWAGYRDKERNKAIWLGSLSGFTYLTVIELLDGHSARWGWSWPDMGANLFGTGLFAGQAFLWDDQRIQFKFSAHKKNYSPSLSERANKLYGDSYPERILKDYNGQTYWLSFTLNSFFPESNFPAWLSFSVGYGAEGLLGGFSNKAYDESGNLVFDGSDIPRQRQWYFSPDIDLTKIKTRSRLLRTVLATFNSLKIPAPTLELTGKKIRFKALYF